jgi:transcriptional regulator NrdR family protein
MKCPQCGAVAYVIDSRPRDSGARHRRYLCFNDHRFSTLEQVQAPRAPRPKTAPVKRRNSVFDV